ncbi:host attachment protein (plasmid) [Tistrella mobilis]|uniref:host attachment protein n=1 Tax=Tistrella mobilis TaxID=171437 RepID=UPI0035570084
MSQTLHPHTTILVADGRKALFLRPSDDPETSDPVVFLEMAAPGEETVPDRAVRAPGTLQNRIGPRSAIEHPNAHDALEHAFGRAVAEKAAALHAAGEIRRLVLVAPPRMLGDLRTHLPDGLRDDVIAEIPRELVNWPVPEIVRVVATEAG